MNDYGKIFDPYKLLSHWEQVERSLTNLTTPPIEVDFSISNICNHQCWFCCDEDLQKQRHVKMPEEHIGWILSELGRIGVKAITFEGGGEPARGHLTYALMRCRKYGMEAGLITNGTLSRGQTTAAAECCRWVRISLDAGTPEVHRKMHVVGEKDWDWIMGVVRDLVGAERPDVGLSFLVSEENEGDVEAFIDLCNELGVAYGQIKELYVDGRPKLLFSPEKAWVQAARASAVPITTTTMNPDGYPYAPHCLASRITGPAIDPTGEVYVCCTQKNPAYSYGIWRPGQPWEAIWHSERRRELVRKLSQTAWNANDHCGLCKIGHANWMLHSRAHPSPHVNFV